MLARKRPPATGNLPFFMSTTTSVPPTIPFSSVIFGRRARIVYPDVEGLADSISQKGLVVPIGLKPLPDGTFLLMHGGRRTRALELLGTTELRFGLSAHPGKPGFVITDKDDDESSDKLTELIENLHRENMRWQEELTLLVQAYRLKRRESLLNPSADRLTYATFGKMVGGYGYSDIQAALAIYDAYMECPEKFDNCTSILNAYQTMLSENAREGEKLLVAAQATGTPTASRVGPTGLEVFAADGVSPLQVPTTIVPLFSRFRLGNSLDWMEKEKPKFDHIICDPDYAIDRDALDSRPNGRQGNIGEGIIQPSVADSLSDLRRFIPLAHDCINDSGFLIMFCDPSHFQTLVEHCVAAGFQPQRWPIIWQKTGPNGWANGAPMKNFPKSYEMAVIARKGQATLNKPQLTSLIQAPNEEVKAALGHPFAKPAAVWNFFFSAFARPGQTTFDPFMGVGSSILPAITFGLVPSGMELQEMHYNRAVLNIQDHYKKQNPNCVFE